MGPTGDPAGSSSGTAVPVTAENMLQTPGQDNVRETAYGKIVIVEPIGTRELNNQFLRKAAALAALKASPFRDAGIVDVRSNFSK
jgi:hypothetical protein